MGCDRVIYITSSPKPPGKQCGTHAPSTLAAAKQYLDVEPPPALDPQAAVRQSMNPIFPNLGDMQNE